MRRTDSQPSTALECLDIVWGRTVGNSVYCIRCSLRGMEGTQHLVDCGRWREYAHHGIGTAGHRKKKIGGFSKQVLLLHSE